MVKKLNCWEFKKCEHKSCPARTEKRLHGHNSGVNAGRACWVVAGTRCGGEKQGVYAQKIANCKECDFYKTVKKEEDIKMESGWALLGLLQD